MVHLYRLDTVDLITEGGAAVFRVLDRHLLHHGHDAQEVVDASEDLPEYPEGDKRSTEFGNVSDVVPGDSEAAIHYVPKNRMERNPSVTCPPLNVEMVALIEMVAPALS